MRVGVRWSACRHWKGDRDHIRVLALASAARARKTSPLARRSVGDIVDGMAVHFPTAEAQARAVSRLGALDLTTVRLEPTVAVEKAVVLADVLGDAYALVAIAVCVGKRAREANRLEHAGRAAAATVAEGAVRALHRRRERTDLHLHLAAAAPRASLRSITALAALTWLCNSVAALGFENREPRTTVDLGSDLTANLRFAEVVEPIHAV
mmetsp:Transcript_128120/g.343834  ORF Transcript_128120/g.343834 Transcript_128120/m.343834 type:complete len:209 (+) Transcript_128120:161-787(+)